MRLASFLLVSSVVVVFGRPSGSDLTEEQFTNLQFTVDKLNAILKAYASYKQYFPDYVWEPVENLTDEQKTQIVQMVNDYHAGKFEPKNFQELLAVLQKSYPAIASTYETVYNKYQDQVATLGPKGQAFAKDMEAQTYADASPDRIVWACHIFNGAKSAVSQAKALLQDDSEAEKIEAAFPEVVKFMNSKEFEAYAIVVNQLQTLDCVKDRAQVFNTIKLFDTQSVITTN
ncbi:unnamed protein product [Caenorhabditis sp. 36 PRJEB53466]|nr:unnamed protein product [Caenorhabditis sp. 36 PRJEB53466]